MGSRIREDVKHYFECFCEVVGPRSDGTEAWIIQKFPETYREEEVLKSVPKFAFPCDFENATIQHYSFVLTSHDSKWTFGFCRHDPKSETALVVLSFLPWHESFTKFLNVISELTHTAPSEELSRFLDAVYQSAVPAPGSELQIPIYHNGQKNFICQSPSQFKLPSIPENRNLTEYYNAVDAHNMMVIFASMLYERRIIFTSRRLNRLSACVQSANSLLYPMNWQHIFIPVLPKQLVDYLLAPMPYLIGVSNTLINKVRRVDMGEVVILDADNNSVETPFNDLDSLPQDVVRQLRAQLRDRATLLGDGVSRAFLRALVQLIGGYRDALRFHQGERITFSQDAFVTSRPASMQPFLRSMLELQTFQQFIEDRLDMLNAGLGFSDEFEMEACNYSDKASSRLKQQYRDWAHHMRRDTSAFFKSVKSRANPAVKSAVKTVKERGRNVGRGIKGIKTKLRESSGPGSGAGSGALPRRPHTALITSATASYRREVPHQRFSTPCDRSQYSPSSPEGSAFNLSPLDMDLMGDLQDVIFRNCSGPEPSNGEPSIDRSLKPVRSLESLPADPFSPTPQADSGLGDAERLISVDHAPLRLPPPAPALLPRQTSKIGETDLIRLDSGGSMDEFDPLLSREPVSLPDPRPISLTNPLYPYFDPQTRPDLDLLREYGLDFNSLTVRSAPPPRAPPTVATVATLQHNWTKFD